MKQDLVQRSILKTGETIALVSSPAYNPNTIVLEEHQKLNGKHGIMTRNCQ